MHFWLDSNVFLATNFCQGVDQDKLGIYIKQVVKDGPAAKVSERLSDAISI